MKGRPDSEKGREIEIDYDVYLVEHHTRQPCPRKKFIDFDWSAPPSPTALPYRKIYLYLQVF